MKKRVLRKLACLTLSVSMIMSCTSLPVVDCGFFVPQVVQAAESAYSHSFADGLSSSFYSIAGNLSTGKGSVNYNGETIKQCLKMESQTSISFNAPSEGTLTLVFGGSKNPAGLGVKVDGKEYTVGDNGIVNVSLGSGSHKITKGDTINLFYMSYSCNGGTVEETTETTTAVTEEPTETTTKAQSSSDAVSAGTYSADDILSSSKFIVSGSTATDQIKISDGYVQFKVNDNASVTINYKCGSSNSSKSAAVCFDGKTSDYLAGQAGAKNFTVSGLDAGTYKITAKQSGGTTAQIISVTISYGAAEETTEATTKATTTTTEATTETTTKAQSSSDAVSAGTYSADDILSSSKFIVSGSTATDQIKISDGYVQFKVNDNASVTINYKCGSSNSSKSAAVCFDGKTSDYLAGQAGAKNFTVSGLDAGTYKITAKQSGGTTAQIISVTISYGTAEETTEATTKDATTTTKKETTTETTTKNPGSSSGISFSKAPSNTITTITSNNSSALVNAVKTLNSSGGTIYIDTPVIEVSSAIKISTSKAGAIVGVRQSDGTYPRLDFTKNRSSGSRGITVSGSNQLIQGLIVENAGDNGIWVSGSDNNIEHVIARYNGDSGIQLSNAADGNKLVGCYSYRNCDIATYGANADGFAPKLGASNTVFEYCYAWDNSDDGWDSYDKSGDKSATVTYRHSACWNNGNTKTFTGEYDFENGDALDTKLWTVKDIMSADSSFASNYKNGKFDTSKGKINGKSVSSWVSSAEGEMNGNGFKFGSKTTEQSESVIRTAENCIAFDHKSKGFDNNNSKGCSGYFYNCMSFDNQRNYSLPYVLKQWENIYGWDYTQSNTANSTPKEPTIPSNAAQVENEVRNIKDQIIAYVYDDKMPDDYGVDFDDVFSMVK